MYECTDKMVSHPDHYISNEGMEVIDVIKNFTKDLNGIEAADTGNIIKYACRWKKKNGVQDLRKIIWYAQHLIDEIESSKKIANKFPELMDFYKKGISIRIIFDGSERNEAYKLIRDLLTLYKQTNAITVGELYDLMGIVDYNLEADDYGWTHYFLTAENDGDEFVLSIEAPKKLNSALYL